MITVAALYIDPRGPYPSIEGVDCWDDGPWPVVAHPPCGPWGKLRHLYRGQEHDCAPRAVDQVRQWGGVLEHPANSLLWNSCVMPYPGEFPDAFGGYSIHVDQCDWGHVARKATWLYLVRVPRAELAWPARREPTHWISGGRGRTGTRTPVPPGIKVCSTQQRRRTPALFAEYLVRLARAAGAARRAA